MFSLCLFFCLHFIIARGILKSHNQQRSQRGRSAATQSATGFDDKTVKHKQFLLEIFWGNLLRSK